jgi:LysM repeat protein
MPVPSLPLPGTAPRRRATGRYVARHATGVDARQAVAATAAPLALATAVTAGAPGWTSYRVRPGDTLSEIAASRATTTAALARANRLADPSMIRIGELLRVPGTTGSARAPATRRSRAVVIRHRVRAGDTVIELAKRYGTSPAAITRTNRLARPGLIRIGAVLAVPVRRSAAVPARTPASRRAGTVVRHRVRPGDTLSTLARRYGTTTAALAAANRLPSPHVIRIGETLVVRATSSARPASRRTFAGRTYSESVVAEADRVRGILAHSRQPSRSQIRAMITATARRHGVDPALALAISMQESGWNQRRVSVAGAIGAMQVMPGTGEWMSGMVGRRLNLLKAQDNVTAGVVLLAYLTRVTRDDRDAIAAYYQGLGNVRRYGYFADTKRYVANVVALRKRYS